MNPLLVIWSCQKYKERMDVLAILFCSCAPLYLTSDLAGRKVVEGGVVGLRAARVADGVLALGSNRGEEVRDKQEKSTQPGHVEKRGVCDVGRGRVERREGEKKR